MANVNVSACEFVQVINADRNVQSNKCGKWFSPKETGSQLISKAQSYLEAYKKYVDFLEAVVSLDAKEIDRELYLDKFRKSVSGLSPEMKEILSKELGN